MIQNVPARSQEPVRDAEQRNHNRHSSGIVHVCGRDRSFGWEEEHNGDEEDPDHRNGVYRLAPPAERVWALDEGHSLLVHAMGDNDGDIT